MCGHNHPGLQGAHQSVCSPQPKTAPELDTQDTLGHKGLEILTWVPASPNTSSRWPPSSLRGVCQHWRDSLLAPLPFTCRHSFQILRECGFAAIGWVGNLRDPASLSEAALPEPQGASRNPRLSRGRTTTATLDGLARLVLLGPSGGCFLLGTCGYLSENHSEGQRRRTPSAAGGPGSLGSDTVASTPGPVG